MSWRNSRNCPSLTCWSNNTRMEHCRPRCTERRHMQTSTWTFSLTHPLAHKLAVVTTLHNRVNTLCTFPNDGLVERKRVSRTLMRNGYPRRIRQGSKISTRDQLRQGSNPKLFHMSGAHLKPSGELGPPRHQNPVSSYHHPQKAPSSCRGPCSHRDDDWCGIPDWMSGLSSHLCGTDRKITCSTSEGVQVSSDKCLSWKICYRRTCNWHRTHHWLEQHSDKGCYSIILAKVHLGDLAHEKPVPPT